MKMLYILLFVIIFIIAGQFLGRRTPAFTDANCIRAIVGEYAESDYQGMKLFAHALRNRKTLKGVYGFNADHVKKEKKDVWVNATLAWYDSLNEFDPLDGASEWRSANDIYNHGWPKGMSFITRYHTTYFFKPTKTGGSK